MGEPQAASTDKSTGLAATIVRLYSPGPDGRSVVGATLDGLKAGGVVVCEDLG